MLQVHRDQLVHPVREEMQGLWELLELPEHLVHQALEEILEFREVPVQ